VLLGLLVLVLSCVALPARADSTFGSVSAPGGVLYDDCIEHPYGYSVRVPGDGTYRALRVSLYGPDGALADTGYVAPAANVASGTSTFRLCRPGDPYGTYTIRATVEWASEPGAPVTSSTLDPAQFSMRKPATRTLLSASTVRPAYGQVVTYRIRALDERPTGYAATVAAWVVLQKRVAGHWVRIKGSRAMTHPTGRIAVRLRYLGHHRPMQVRAVTQPTSRYARSTSPVLHLW
jgi:hypothetical protein